MLPAMVRSTWLLGVSTRLQAVPAPGLALTALVLLNLMWGGSLPATKLALESFRTGIVTRRVHHTTPSSRSSSRSGAACSRGAII